MTAKLNTPIADFTCHITGNKTIKLSDLKGKNIVLYFYPKDNTPGCTLEGKDFRDSIQEFQKLNTVILGISRDSVAAHEKFKSKCEFPFDLISDKDETLCNYFNVLGEKSMFGITINGLVRSTFLIDSKGVLQKEWRKVKVSGHAQEVLQSVRELHA